MHVGEAQHTHGLRAASRVTLPPQVRVTGFDRNHSLLRQWIYVPTLWLNVRRSLDIMAYMSIVEPAPKSRSPGTRPAIDGDVEVVLERRAWAERDRLLIFVWSGEAPLLDVLAERRWGRPRRPWFLWDAKGSLIQVKVCYAGNVVVCSEIADSGGVACFILTHSGSHLDAAAFSLWHDATPHDKGQNPIVRAVIVLQARPETETELLARRLFPEPDNQPQPYPGTTELFALRRALSR
jgi:hypothetical protein